MGGISLAPLQDLCHLIILLYDLKSVILLPALAIHSIDFPRNQSKFVTDLAYAFVKASSEMYKLKTTPYKRFALTKNIYENIICGIIAVL